MHDKGAIPKREYARFEAAHVSAHASSVRRQVACIGPRIHRIHGLVVKMPFLCGAIEAIETRVDVNATTVGSVAIVAAVQIRQKIGFEICGCSKVASSFSDGVDGSIPRNTCVCQIACLYGQHVRHNTLQQTTTDACSVLGVHFESTEYAIDWCECTARCLFVPQKTKEQFVAELSRRTDKGATGYVARADIANARKVGRAVDIGGIAGIDPRIRSDWTDKVVSTLCSAIRATGPVVNVHSTAVGGRAVGGHETRH